MNIAEWNDLFVATAGAGATLAGLIIVAMSVNIATIITFPAMTSRGATAVAGPCARPATSSATARPTAL